MLITATITVDDLFLVSKILSIIYSVMAVIGILGNVLIVATTIRSKKLRATCNILIAIEASCGIIVLVTQFDFTYFAFANILIPQSMCFYVAMSAVVSMDFSVIMIAFIALERYLCTSYPILHKRIKPSVYVGIACISAVIYISSFRILAYFTVVDFPVMCIIPFATFGVAVDVWFISNFCINAAVVLLYVLIQRKVKASVTEMNEYNKINKSLQTHVCVYLLGWASVFTMCIMIKFNVKE